MCDTNYQKTRSRRTVKNDWQNSDTCSVNIMIKIVVILMYLFEYSL